MPCVAPTTNGCGKTMVPITIGLHRWQAIAPGAMDLAIEEIQRVATLGFKGLSLPCKPVFGPPDVDDSNYNLKEFEPLWDCVEEVGLPITFHVSTGRDPRTSRSQGGAVINYAIHSLLPSAEPIANICASGVGRADTLIFALAPSKRVSVGSRSCWMRWMRPTRNTTCGCALN